MKPTSPKAFALVLGTVLIFGIAFLFVIFRAGPGPESDQGGIAVPGVTGAGGPARTFISGGDTTASSVTLSPVKTVDPAHWEARIEELIANPDITTSDAIRELLAMAGDPRGAEALRIDAVEHGLNLLEDEDYFRDAIALAINPSLPEAINDILFADLHNRDQSISVAVAGRIAKTPGHPLAEEAKDFVDFFEEEPLSEGPAAPSGAAPDRTPAK